MMLILSITCYFSQELAHLGFSAKKVVSRMMEFRDISDTNRLHFSSYNFHLYNHNSNHCFVFVKVHLIEDAKS